MSLKNKIKSRGKVYLVGAGPGSPDLITLKGLEILRQADVVIYDYLVDKRILAEAKSNTELICCDTLGKHRYSDGFLIHNEKINQLVIKKAKEGKMVVRLKNGDPGIFSRTSQELEPLVKNKIDFEIVPGVTAASGASGFTGIPLTDRRFASDCIFITGHEDPTKQKSSLDWASLAKNGTIVFYMAVENLPKIVNSLLKAGKSSDTPIAIIQDATFLTQKVLTGSLKDIVVKANKHKMKPPAIIIIGQVVNLRKKFDWFSRRKKIIYTGTTLEGVNLKGIIFHQPMIKLIPLKDFHLLDKEIENISNYDFIIFNSRFGVKFFLERVISLGKDCRILSGITLCSIGKVTAKELLNYGLKSDLISLQESSEGIIQTLKEFNLKDKNILITASNLSSNEEADILTKQGAKAKAVLTYLNIRPEIQKIDTFSGALMSGRKGAALSINPEQISGSSPRFVERVDLNFIDDIYFLSPSGINNFLFYYKTIPSRIKIRCIGKTTLGYLQKRGYKGTIFKD